MSSNRNRMVILVAVVTVMIGLLACSSSTLLSRRDEATATPTKTLKPTFTATMLPTKTPVPTKTVPPTPTPTKVLPTNTPVVQTATYTPSPQAPTNTPLPSATPVPPTNTPKPTKKPTKRPAPTATKKPAPTNTPAPQYAWTGTVIGTFSQCAYTGIYGHTLDRNGGLAGDIWIHYWTDGWNGAWAQSSWVEDPGQSWIGDEKNWDGFLKDYPVTGTWYACVVPEDGNWDCVSNKMTLQTVAEPCAPDSGGIQVVRIVFQQN